MKNQKRAGEKLVKEKPEEENRVKREKKQKEKNVGDGVKQEEDKFIVI